MGPLDGAKVLPGAREMGGKSLELFEVKSRKHLKSSAPSSVRCNRTTR